MEERIKELEDRVAQLEKLNTELIEAMVQSAKSIQSLHETDRKILKIFNTLINKTTE